MSKTSLSSLSLKDYEYLDKNGIPPICGVPLLFASAASPKGVLNLLNITGGRAQNGTGVCIWQFFPGKPNWNFIWQLTPQGHIVCPYFPQFALGISSGSLCILTRNEADPTQIWELSHYEGGYSIGNISQNVLITTGPQSDNGWQSPGTLDLAAANGTPPNADQLWLILPAEPLPSNKFYIQTQMSGHPCTGNQPWLVTVNAAQPDNVICSPWVPGSALQLWQFNEDGTIASANDPSSILISNSKSAKDTTPVTLAGAGTAISAAYYTWSFKENFLSVNLPDIGEIGLNANKSTWNDPLMTYEDTYGSNCFWYLFPEQSTPPGKWIYITAYGTKDPYAVLTAETYNGPAGSGLTLMELQHGNPAQLWQLNSQGMLVSALSPNLVLSVDTDNGNALITQVTAQSGCLQNWCYGPNGTLIAGTNGSVFYLNMASLPASGSNGSVSLVTSQHDPVSTNVVWDILDYKPEISGQWFTIYSGLSSPKDNLSYVLTMDDNWYDVTLNPPLGSNVLKEGSPSFHQLWRWTLEGYLVSAVNPYLALTYDPDTQNAVMVPTQPGNANQQWSWGAATEMDYTINKKSRKVRGGNLMNNAAKLSLYAAAPPTEGSYTPPAASLVSAADTANQNWFIVPYRTNYDQPTTIRNVGGSAKTPGLFIALQEQNSTSYSVSLENAGNDQSLTTWKFVHPGYITSVADAEIVLGLKISGTAGSLIYGPDVTAMLRLPYPQDAQLWTATDDGLLINNKTGLALCATSTDLGAGLSTSVIGDTTTSNPELDLQLWEFSPGQALQTVLLQPPIEYPGLSETDSNEQSYYQAISDYLGLPLGLRSQYMNLAAPLSSYQSEMNAYVMEQTGGNPTGDWLATLKQLNQELTSVIAVQRFFQQAGSFHLALNQAQSMILSEMVTACGLPLNTTVKPQKKNKSWIWDLCEQVVYTSLNAAGLFVGDPDAGTQAESIAKIVTNGFPVAANVMSTTFTAGQAGLESRKQGTNFGVILQHIYNYELKVLQLQETLDKVFEASANALAQIETLVLSDWGKISAVYEMIKLPAGLNSLFWPPDLSPNVAKKLLTSYGNGVLQTLIPATGFNLSGMPFSGYPSSSKQLGLTSSGNAFNSANIDNSYSGWVANFPPQVLNLIWSNGTRPLDFFRQTNGWDVVQLNYNHLVSGGAGDGTIHYASVVVTIQNCTTQQLSLDVSGIVNGLPMNSPTNGYALAGNTNATSPRDLAAFGLAQFAAYSWMANPDGNEPMDYGAYGTFNISDASGTVVAGTLDSNARYGMIGTPEYTVKLAPSAPYKARAVRKNSHGLWLFRIFIYQ